MQYRGFGYLHARVILALQYDLEVLERELETLDKWDLEDGNGERLKSKALDDSEIRNEELPADCDGQRNRLQVLADLKRKLLEYGTDEMLLKAREMSALQRPADSDWRSLSNWMYSKAPLVAQEQEFAKRKEDIVTLRKGREGAAFDNLVERMLGRTNRFFHRCGWEKNIIQYVFVTKELEDKTSEDFVRYYDPVRVDKLVNIIITAIIFVLLVLPVVALYEMSDASKATPFEAIGILVVFTLIFGMAMSSLTRATRQELFAASAAYCAVLVVFISNFTPQTVEIAT
ncbi:hypothetical protein WHR41_04596 [Cladosporium halotolerans]|uniref:DUF6594 domain-containing protein n=1 Tax=Cladosporium halotolerans TaxID=1052096 RepID=A0AB34KPU6_9PEZI